MSKLEIDIDHKFNNKLEVKFPSMPLTTKSLKGHSRLSSTFESVTNASSVQTSRYDVAAKVLDWDDEHLTDEHK